MTDDRRRSGMGKSSSSSQPTDPTTPSNPTTARMTTTQEGPRQKYGKGPATQRRGRIKRERLDFGTYGDDSEANREPVKQGKLPGRRREKPRRGDERDRPSVSTRSVKEESRSDSRQWRRADVEQTTRRKEWERSRTHTGRADTGKNGKTSARRTPSSDRDPVYPPSKTRIDAWLTSEAESETASWASDSSYESERSHVQPRSRSGRSKSPRINYKPGAPTPTAGIRIRSKRPKDLWQGSSDT